MTFLASQNSGCGHGCLQFTLAQKPGQRVKHQRGGPGRGCGGGRGVKTARGRGGTSPASNAAATSDLRSHTDSSTYVHPLPTPCPGTGNGQTEVSKKARSGPCRERPLALSSRGRVGRASRWRDKHSQIWRSLSSGQD